MILALSTCIALAVSPRLQETMAHLLGGGIQPFPAAPEYECVPNGIKVFLIIGVNGRKGCGTEARQTQQRPLHPAQPHLPRYGSVLRPR